MVRLYTPYPLVSDSLVEFTEDQAHYLRNVMRMKESDDLTLFNAHDGEWKCIIAQLKKNGGQARVAHQVRQQEKLPFLGLIFSPLKHDPQGYLIEKSTEIGVTLLQPVLLERSVVHRFNSDKVRKNVIEASQQCERLEVPDVYDCLSFRDVLSKVTSEGASLLVCQERGQDKHISKVIGTVPSDKPLYILIGPEGGITPGELDILSKVPNCFFCHLGSLILRAETAAVYALTAVQCYRS